MIRRTSLLVLLLVALPAMASAEIGRVKRVVGAVAIERAKTRLVPAVGQALEQGDVLVTGPTGRISITFADNSRFSVGPKSRIAIPEFRFDDTTHKGAFVTRVDRGSLAVISGQIAHENKDAMRVRTPTSLLGVRGTRFVVNVR